MRCALQGSYLIAAILAAWALPSAADSTQARCEIYTKGSDKLEKMVPCTFGQRQGYITITREDGVTHDLSPVGDGSGNYRDVNQNRRCDVQQEPRTGTFDVQMFLSFVQAFTGARTLPPSGPRGPLAPLPLPLH